jgi:hypothetical protein
MTGNFFGDAMSRGTPQRLKIYFQSGEINLALQSQQLFSRRGDLVDRAEIAAPPNPTRIGATSRASAAPRTPALAGGARDDIIIT